MKIFPFATTIVPGIMELMQLIDGKALASVVREEVATVIQKWQRAGRPSVRFDAVLVGEDPASLVYIRNKRRACEAVGIQFTLHQLPADCRQTEIVTLIKKLSADPKVAGVLLQLPLPVTVVGGNVDEILAVLDPNKDVDGITPTNLGRLVAGSARLIPCTAQGVLYAIQSVCPQLAKKNVVMIGRSRIVGCPTSLLLGNHDATVTVCHRQTRDLKLFTKTADIIVVATGKPGLITADMVSPDAIVIDVGINRLPDGRLVGDVDFDRVAPKVRAITPVPGGIGPLTIAFLLRNVVTAYQIQHGL